ncbi:hypothetical protein [Nonomuraea insulae]|uniref:Uncharacterized protein n=1 Tax=Nonomuraea insulae TaxID=1616787 RepID=A0ABW1D9A0_9ACTN
MRALLEGLAVVRAGCWRPVSLGVSLVCGFSGDVDELFPGDGSSSVKSLALRQVTP